MQDYQNPITQNAWTNSKMDTPAALVTTIAGLTAYSTERLGYVSISVEPVSMVSEEGQVALSMLRLSMTSMMLLCRCVSHADGRHARPSYRAISLKML